MEIQAEEGKKADPTPEGPCSTLPVVYKAQTKESGELVSIFNNKWNNNDITSYYFATFLSCFFIELI